MNGFDVYRQLGELSDETVREALTYRQPRRTLRWALPAAACLVLVAGLFAGRVLHSGTAELGKEQVQIANPWRESSAQEVAELLGHEMGVPSTATQVDYSVMTADEQQGSALAQADFTLDGQSYCYRVQAVAQQEDISGYYTEWTQQDDCEIGGMSGTLRYNEGEAGVVQWYDQSSGQQYSLSVDTGATKELLLVTADQILQTLGLDVDVAPEGAQDVSYDIVDGPGGIQLAQTSFTLDGVRWVYRIATEYTEENISGVDAALGADAQDELGWCTAQLHWDEGGQGYVTWYDAAPGLLYSLSADTNATEQGLLAMASRLYVPAQDDVG